VFVGLNNPSNAVNNALMDPINATISIKYCIICGLLGNIIINASKKFVLKNI
jgi:hypothetical protein